MRFFAGILALVCTFSAVHAGEVKLADGLTGTYLSATNRSNSPQVLILAGSGPTDRDGNNPLGVQAQSYKLLAEGLARNGISSTRVDKRGMFGSAAGAANANGVFVTQLAQDARQWVLDIKRTTGARCVWLLGHSEGGLVALLAAQDNRDVCGLILVASPGRKIGDTLREQFASNPANAPILADANASLATLEAGRDVDVSRLHPALRSIFAPSIQGFLKSLLQVNPAELVGSYNGRVLILQGATDLQVTIADARALAAAQPRASFVVLDGVNHVLKVAPIERGANLATYADPSLPIAPELISKITAFVTQR